MAEQLLMAAAGDGEGGIYSFRHHLCRLCNSVAPMILFTGSSPKHLNVKICAALPG
ncbi:hypothetical protein J4734_15340 [Klebsiella pneumoniae]|uniref:Uncharacterized protein n=1 Tax=Klebsiella pneumoniae TaxID=573 RepID=A0A939NR99_KLEPN|nr:hypothetical protein [Klebsiella pneumoniae]